MENPYKLVTELLEDIENRRTQDVIRRRFGLIGGQPQTLQEIGEEYNITRERVRQIEKNGLDYLNQQKIQDRIKLIENEIHQYFKDYGELRREEKLFDDLIYHCFPASPTKKVAVDENEAALCRAALNLILTLGRPFIKVPETDEFHPAWTINKNSIKKAQKLVDSAVKYFEKRPQVLKDEELFKVLRTKFPDASDKAIFSYIDASKRIEQNSFGEFGLIDWPEISPRGVRDKAFLVLKKEGKPYHFSEVTNMINQQLGQGRPAYIQTVHNELIKDPRFVLIGRGIYALSEWGYQPGTVVDVIKDILKSNGPLNKEEIVKRVLDKRLIKENTILINLQNKKYFKKMEDGRYSLVA